MKTQVITGGTLSFARNYSYTVSTITPEPALRVLLYEPIVCSPPPSQDAEMLLYQQPIYILDTLTWWLRLR